MARKAKTSTAIALSHAFPAAPPVTVKVGVGSYLQDREFTLGGQPAIYVIAEVDPNEIVLVNIRTGVTWNSPVTVSDTDSLTRDELVELTGDFDDFDIISREDAFRL
jgi:hypothetical protein